GAIAAFAGIVGEAAFLGALVERPDGVGAERPKTHRGNIEHRGRIGAAMAADIDAEMIARDRGGGHRMVQPFIAFGINVIVVAERALVKLPLVALIDNGALVA